MPISNNGVLSIAVGGDYIFVGSGDGKIKKIYVADGKWNLTNEAHLDSKVMSICLSIDQKELVVGTIGGKIYRVLENDLSFLLHTDSHTGAISDLSFSPKRSDQFLSIDQNGCIKVWDLSEYKSVFTANPTKQAVGTSCFVSIDDDSMVTGWSDGFIRCFEKGN